MSSTGTTTTAPPLLELKQISKRFVTPLDTAEKLARLLGSDVRERIVRAVDEVSLAIGKGEVLGLVGESGCGKSTLGRIVAGIYPATSGQRLWQGGEVDALAGAQRIKVELAIQMVFQDPFASLNPRMRVDEAIAEAPLAHGVIERGQRDDYVDDMLHRVGLDPAYKRRLPHQFSGGQRSRIGIARALAVKPELLVCDEAVAALDVSIQAQVLNLFMKLRREFELTYLFISHDLGVVEHLSDRVAIMYLGRLVEIARAEEIFARANHPYTQALLASVPRIDSAAGQFQAVKGEIPSPLDPPPGCHFHPRCPHAFARCPVEAPALKQIAPGHFSACHLNDRS